MAQRAGAARDGVRLAYGTLTRIPVPTPEVLDRAAAGFAMAWGWILVFPMMLVIGGVGWALSFTGLPTMALGLVVVGLVQLATRFMHADGLADTADGLGASRSRSGALAVMRKGDIGPFGVVTLILVLGVQAATVGELSRLPMGWLAVGGAFAVSRASLAIGVAVGVPSARSVGLGAAVAGSIRIPVLVVALVLSSLALTAVGWGSGIGYMAGALAWAASFAVASWLLAYAVRRLGGITGDVLGALVEVTATGSLLVLAALDL